MFSKIYDQQVEGVKYLYETHKNLHNMGVSIDKQFEDFSSYDSAPPYVLAAASAYFLKVKCKVRKSDWYFKRYRVKLSRLQMFNKQFKDISNSNMAFDSAVFKVDISRNNLGRIVDYTPGYKDHLGEPPNG